MSYITTYTGKHFDPSHPDTTKLDIRDIAHALSLICRGNGHVKTFFSVGQHCINCALEAIKRGYGKRIILACLLHDASEAYMSDVPRPLKQNMPEYIWIEEQLLDCIYTHFLGTTLSKEEQHILKKIDDDLLYFDMKELLHETIQMEEPKIHITVSYEFVSFDFIEKTYLELYETYR